MSVMGKHHKASPSIVQEKPEAGERGTSMGSLKLDSTHVARAAVLFQLEKPIHRGELEFGNPVGPSIAATRPGSLGGFGLALR